MSKKKKKKKKKSRKTPCKLTLLWNSLPDSCGTFWGQISGQQSLAVA